MASWKDFKDAEPQMAEFAHPLLFKPGPEGAGLAYLATVRPDGGPRVHPLCIYPVRDAIYVCIERESPKAADLRRDSRYMLHAYPGWDEDPEFSMRGRAQEITDAGEVEALGKEEPRLTTETAPYVFRLDIDRADTTFWENWPKPDMKPIRRRWSPSRVSAK